MPVCSAHRVTHPSMLRNEFDMNFAFVRHAAVNSSLVGILICGCSKEAPPPKPLAVEEAPASLEEVFKELPKQASTQAAQDSQVKQLVSDARAALSAKDYAKAIFALQALSGRSDLTDAQRDFATRAMLSVHQALEQAASAGDLRAQQALELRRATK